MFLHNHHRRRNPHRLCENPNNLPVPFSWPSTTGITASTNSGVVKLTPAKELPSGQHPNDPIFPCRPNLDEQPRSYVDSSQYRSTKLASTHFQKRPPVFPYPNRSPSAESKSYFYLFLFQKLDSLIYRIIIQNLFSSYLLHFRSDFSAFHVGVILATRRLDL